MTENELTSLIDFLKNKKVNQEVQLTSLVRDRGINGAIIYLRGACHKTSITSNDLTLIDSHLKLLGEYKNHLQRLVSKKSFVEQTPYWLLHKLADEKRDQDCQFDPQHECSKTDLCLTEYCVVCAAKKWIEDCGNT